MTSVTTDQQGNIINDVFSFIFSSFFPRFSQIFILFISFTYVVFDSCIHILTQGMKKLEIKEMKRSPSAVFSWPSFVNNKSVREIVQPITKNGLHPNGLVQVRSTDSARSVLWV